MSVRLLADGADGYRLVDADDGIVGWVRGRVIGVAGYPDQNSAIVAALRAFGGLAAWVQSEIASPGSRSISLVYDGAYKWLAAGGVPVARLIPRPSERVESPPTH